MSKPTDKPAAPVKPRRSVKFHKSPQDDVQQVHRPANNHPNERGLGAKMSPALTLGGQGLQNPSFTSLRDHTLLWFESTQLPRLSQHGHQLPCWMHGFTTRREAEEQLKDSPEGSFLLRLSESKIGFVLSYRGQDRCRHFIIEEEGDGKYLIAGEESRHSSLHELVQFYMQNPVGPFEERLTIPCSDSRHIFSNALELQDEGSTNATGACEKETALSLPKNQTYESTQEQLQTLHVAPSTNTDTTAEYAVVKKNKKLTRSRTLPEIQMEEPNVNRLMPPVNPDNLCTEAEEDVTRAVADCQYARVNKPPKATKRGNESSSYVNVMGLLHQEMETELTRGDVQCSPYGELEANHTYEEASCRPKQAPQAHQGIGFYAVGSWKDIIPDSDPSELHIYSEVNLRNNREGLVNVPSTAKASPGPPSRPPLDAKPLKRIDTLTSRQVRGQIPKETMRLQTLPLPPNSSGSSKANLL